VRVLVRVAAVAMVAVVVAALVVIGLTHTRAERLGVDEITYIDLRAAQLGPGASITQPTPVQADGLSRVGLLYSSPGPGTSPLRVTVRSGGAVIADRTLRLDHTLSGTRRQAWWEQSLTNSIIQMAEVPIEGRAAGSVTVTATVPAGGRPVALYWSPPHQGAPASAGDSSRRYAVRTEYGPVRPALAQAPLVVERMARYGPPWLPAPALWTLAALTALLLAALAGRAAGPPEPGPNA
jgi:hypothetical protein